MARGLTRRRRSEPDNLRLPSSRATASVLHVAALVSTSGAYGGPVSVAIDQCRSLPSSGGYASTLVAGWDGRAPEPTVPSVILRRAYLLSARSFASLFSPALLVWMARNVSRFDVVHVHYARDLVTTPAAIIAVLRRVPLVVQPHGMVQPDTRTFVRLYDRLITRPLLRRAATVFALTSREAEGLRSFSVGDSRVRMLENGAPEAASTAQYQAVDPVVVFASRLAPRKRPLNFVRAAAIVLRSRPDVQFEIWGPDEGEEARLRAEIQRLGLSGACFLKGSTTPEHVRRMLPRRHAFVLPSFAEPFPVALLEALSAGLPSVITHDTGLSSRCGASGAAVVTDGSDERLAGAILALLEDRGLWERTSLAAQALVREELSLDRICEELSTHYDQARRTSSRP